MILGTERITNTSNPGNNGRAAPPEPEPQILDATRLSEISPQEVRWRWQDRFPLAMLSVVAGDPGLFPMATIAALCLATYEDIRVIGQFGAGGFEPPTCRRGDRANAPTIDRVRSVRNASYGPKSLDS